MSKRSEVFWDMDAERFVSERWEGAPTAQFDRDETLKLLQWFVHHSGPRILEVGCGPGYWLRHEKLCNAIQFGIDRSRKMVETACDAGDNAMQADAHALPFKDCALDGVIMVHAMEYFRSPADALRETNRVLVAGGMCCVITKNCHGLPWRAALWLADRLHPNPLRFNRITIEDITADWHGEIVGCWWLSSRLITDLNDVNDAVEAALPSWAELMCLDVAVRLRRWLTVGWLGKRLAWHVGLVLRKGPVQ